MRLTRLFFIVAAVGCLYAQGRKLRNLKHSEIRASSERGKDKDAFQFLKFFCPDDSANKCMIWGDDITYDQTTSTLRVKLGDDKGYAATNLTAEQVKFDNENVNATLSNDTFAIVISDEENGSQKWYLAWKRSEGEQDAFSFGMLGADVD
jgi:hypothetical protein